MNNLTIVWFVVGLFGLWFGADIIINASIKLAKKMRISEAFIGLTILSIGTSLPEISTHIIASLDILMGKIAISKASAISIGTNIGSNLIQITLITGILGLMTVIYTNKKILKQDYLIMLGSILLLFLFSIDGGISRLEGIVLVGLYIYYLYYLAKKEKIAVKIGKKNREISLMGDLVKIIVGLAILLFSADRVLTGAIDLAQAFNVTESLIGVLIIGVSTALPELTTALRAILKGSTGLSLGTLIGSNITNPMLALGLGAAISGYTVERTILFFDIPFWFFTSLAIYFFFKRGLKLFKYEAILMIAAYIVFVLFRLGVF